MKNIKRAVATAQLLLTFPAVLFMGALVYVGSAQIGSGDVYALNAATGAPLWSYPAGSYLEPLSSPAVVNGAVYISVGANVYAFNQKGGQLTRTALKTLHPNLNLKPSQPVTHLPSSNSD